jgi:hypothetical protein
LVSLATDVDTGFREEEGTLADEDNALVSQGDFTLGDEDKCSEINSPILYVLGTQTMEPSCV